MTSARRPDVQFRARAPGPAAVPRRRRSRGTTRATPATSPEGRTSRLGFGPPSRGRQGELRCVRHHERCRAQVLHRVRHLAGPRMPGLWRAQPGRREVLRGVRDRARGRRSRRRIDRPTAGLRGADHRAAAGVRPVPRPRRLHGALGAPRLRADARTSRRLFRHRPHRHRAARRRGGEVHRRRRDGCLGDTGHSRGRRGARRPRRARARRRGDGAGVEPPGSAACSLRHPHRRGGDDAGRRPSGHGHRRHGEHRLPPAVRRRSRLGPGR